MPEQTISVLVYAVRTRVVLEYCGQLALMLALLTLSPLLFSILNFCSHATSYFSVACWRILAHYRHDLTLHCFKRMVITIKEPIYEYTCIDLVQEDIITPDYSIARYLADLCAGQNPLQLSAVIKGEARIFSFVAREQDEGLVSELKLPADCRTMFLYRNENFFLQILKHHLKKMMKSLLSRASRR